MSGDETHVKWAQYAAVAAGIGMFALGIDLLPIIGLVWLFLFGTKYISPYMSINSAPYMRWGLLRVMIYPYAEMIGKRKIARNLIIGPVLAVSYFMCVVLALCIVLNRFWLPVIEPMIDQLQEILTQVMALSLNSENATLLGAVVACLIAAAAYQLIVDRIFKEDRQE